MAKKTIEKFYSDLSGDEITDNGGTVSFAFDGTSYESGGRRAPTSSKASYDAKAVRAWATENKIDVPSRGRIPATVLEAYAAAN